MKSLVKSNIQLVLCVLYLISIGNLIISPFIALHYIDELIVLVLCAIYLIIRIKSREFIYVCIILFIYLVYSSLNGINTVEALVLDFILFTKPFVCFYVVAHTYIFVSQKYMNLFKCISFVFGIICWFYLPFISNIYDNTTAFYPICIFSAVSYLFFSKNANSKYIAFLFLIPGLFTFRSKFIAEFIVFIYLFFFLGKRIKFSFKYIIVLLTLITSIIYVNWEKFSFYFISGYDEGLARSLMYYTSLIIFVDYFPFGSGFATFGTEAAARYYSPLYYKYDLHVVYGLRFEDYGTSNHFFCDTFYPILAQFGIVGVFLYFIFWLKRWKEGKMISCKIEYQLFLFLFITMIIQNIADNTFTGPYSVPIMMTLGLLLSKQKIYA